MKWEKVIFGELFDSPSRNGIYIEQDKHGAGVKMVNMGEIFAYDFIGAQDMKRVELSLNEMSTLLLREDDLLFARRSLVESGAGKSSIVQGLKEPTTFESSIIRVRLKSSLCCPLFYLYWLRSLAGKEAIGALVTGTNVKGIRGSELKNIKVDYPPYAIQIRIANVLKEYDNLIENNQKQIKLLEEAAQRLYKEWFVDLRFPGHENTKITDGIPEGWTRCALGDLIDFNPKVSLSKERKKQSVPMSALSTSSMTLDMAEVYTTESNAGSKFQNGDTLLARITPCLENGKTAFVAGIEAQEGAVGSTEFIVMRSRRLNPYMVYLLARTDDFRNSAINSMTGSDGRQRAQVDKLQALPHLEPPREIIDTFEKNIAPLFLQIRRKNEMNWHLREARDLLLPKLMSGKIEV